MPDTVVAEVIVVFGNARSVTLAVRFEHVSAVTGVAPNAMLAASTASRAPDFGAPFRKVRI